MMALALAVAASGVARGEERWVPALPERVTFRSGDERTELTGYVFRRMPPTPGRLPAVVMMHGRAGAYSTRAGGRFEASTLSRRHKAWGAIWAQAGYLALLVDGFGPRGYPAGFPRFSYNSRPAELDEVSVRPLDAFGALAYLRSRGDVQSDHIGLQGWSNGASAVLSAIATIQPAAPGFRAALAFYPGCGLKGAWAGRPLLPSAPTLVLHGSADEEVSAGLCEALVERSRAAGGTLELRLYPGATHSFDSPDARRQSVPANAAATGDAVDRSLAFFAQHLKGR